MTAEESLRFLAHETAWWSRYQDEAESICLLVPVLVKAAGLEPMNGYEAEAFRARLREWLEAEGRIAAHGPASHPICPEPSNHGRRPSL